MSRLRRFIEERRGVTVTFLMIPDASRRTRSWRVPLLRVYSVAGLAVALLLAAVFAYSWAGSAALLIAKQRADIKALAQEKRHLEEVTSEQEARLLAMAEEATQLAERIAQLEELAQQIMEIVPDDILAASERAVPGAVLGVSAGADSRDAVAVAAAAGLPPADEAGVLDDVSSMELTGMGGGEISTEEINAWLQGYLGSLRAAVEHHDRLFLQLKWSAESYEHKLRHTPSIWPVEGRITSEYGYRRHPITGRNHLHAGIDIAVPTGTPVKATAAGKVVHAGPDGGYGLTVVIDHGYGWRTLYAHNSRVLVKAGDTVERGDVIALAGSTGVSTGPHVHYEVHVDGKPVNPRAFLP
ncbi:MAG: M23 family metallopeptidase [Limnochordia bacterium]